jgi:hypothetical protein
MVSVLEAVEPMVRPRETEALCTGLLESFTVKVSGLALAAAVGVPMIAPVDAFRLRPEGSVPEERDQVYGVVPPVATRVAL